eukprot:110048_1
MLNQMSCCFKHEGNKIRFGIAKDLFFRLIDIITNIIVVIEYYFNNSPEWGTIILADMIITQIISAYMLHRKNNKVEFILALFGFSIHVEGFKYWQNPLDVRYENNYVLAQTYEVILYSMVGGALQIFAVIHDNTYTISNIFSIITSLISAGSALSGRHKAWNKQENIDKSNKCCYYRILSIYYSFDFLLRSATVSILLTQIHFISNNILIFSGLLFILFMIEAFIIFIWFCCGRNKLNCSSLGLTCFLRFVFWGITGWVTNFILYFDIIHSAQNNIQMRKAICYYMSEYVFRFSIYLCCIVYLFTNLGNNALSMVIWKWILFGSLMISVIGMIYMLYDQWNEKRDFDEKNMNDQIELEIKQNNIQYLTPEEMGYNPNDLIDKGDYFMTNEYAATYIPKIPKKKKKKK